MEALRIRYGDEYIEFRVRAVPRRRGRVVIHVLPDGSVQVDAPAAAAMDAVKQAVLKRARWVLQHVRQARARREHVLPRQYTSGETHFYLGRRYQLKVTEAPDSPETVKLMHGRFQINVRQCTPVTVQCLLQRWYRVHAENRFARRIGAWSQNLGHEPPPWRLLTMKTQWGSCSPNSVILLNPHLVKAPPACIDYVILHELCHLMEHNHSPRFYALLERAMPDWRRHKQRLDEMAALLLNG